MKGRSPMSAGWQFGEVEIRPTQRRVLRAGVPQPLGGRAFPSQIRDRLDQRFALLTGAPRGAHPRHQTLRHAVQWSCDQLFPAEPSKSSTWEGLGLLVRFMGFPVAGERMKRTPGAL